MDTLPSHSYGSSPNFRHQVGSSRLSRLPLYAVEFVFPELKHFTNDDTPCTKRGAP